MTAATLSPPPVPAAAGPGLPVDAGAGRYGVTIGGHRLLLGAHSAVRVLEPPEASRLPNTPAWFLGLSNVRGTLIPVHDLAALLGVESDDRARMLLVLGEGDVAAGFLIDASPRHLMLASEAPGGAPVALPPPLAAHAGDGYDIAGDTWTELDWDALLDELGVMALHG